MRKFDSGATRDTVEGKLNYVKALSPVVLQRYVQYLNAHREQPDGSIRDFDNWKKGIPIEAYFEGLGRHFLAVWLLAQGFPAKDNHGPVTLEDSLCAMMFNVSGWLHELLQEKSDGSSPGYVGDLKVIKDYIHFCDCATLHFPPGCWASTVCDKCGGVKPVEDDKPEEFEGFNIRRQPDILNVISLPSLQWYASPIDDCSIYLHKDLKLHGSTGWTEHDGYGGTPGYYPTKAEAREAIKAYKSKPVFEIKHLDRSGCGWIARNNNLTFLWKDLTLHPGTGYSKFCDEHHYPPKRGEAPGYYLTKEIAEAYVKAYEEKTKE